MRRLLLTAALALLGAACGSPCGPGSGTVAFVIDGDTIELTSGVKIRYLSIDTPESTGGKNDCYGVAAADENRALVDGKTVQLAYDDAVCTDKYGRTLAWVTVDGTDVNKHLVQQGFACSYYLPPGGEKRADEFATCQSEAQTSRVGMWGSCTSITCGN